MSILAAAVVFVGLLCLTDLLLTLGVIRRLRDHTSMIASMTTSEHRAVGVTALANGTLPAPFQVDLADDTAIAGPAGVSVVAFFSTTCPICPERVPTFADYLRAHLVRLDEVLAVVTGENPDHAPYLADLSQVAQIHKEEHGGPIGRAFGVRGFPAFFLLNADGTVLASGYDPAMLPAPAVV